MNDIVSEGLMSRASVKNQAVKEQAIKNKITQDQAVMTQSDIIDSLPAHLRPFAAIQHYENYTPRDQAVWRFLLQQLRENLSATAHPVYLDGLEQTGINLESIPRIETMNQCLKNIGWRAVVVDGFVPPAIFMAFQAYKVLVIAVNMRSMAHMLYTPAPDIVHESAGHVPFIVDVDYAEFLQRFGELGMRAIASKDDMAVYEAIRYLSIVKEAASSTEQDIALATKKLQTTIAANNTPSEAALLARLHWWTVEYGLVGQVDDYKIFGAGLLSSLGESVSCLDDEKVKKVPLTVDAVLTSYDITSEQTQLFVTKNCRHLSQVLEEFGRQMCVSRGGIEAVKKAIAAQTVNTAVSNSGIEVSGQFSELLTDAIGNLTYIKTIGPSQLSYAGVEIDGHGITYHHEGFGSPIGRLQAMERCLSSYTVDELKQHGIVKGEQACLEFLSGITVRGTLLDIIRRDQKNILLRFSNCRVTRIDGQVLFAPEWGVYDMIVGTSILSVYGGAADPQGFPLYQAPSSQVTIQTEYTDEVVKLFDIYKQVRQIRESHNFCEEQQRVIQRVISQVAECCADEWLLIFECIELAQQAELLPDDYAILVERIKVLARNALSQDQDLIEYALKRLNL